MASKMAAKNHEHMHMVYVQFRCTYLLYMYLFIILHVSSIHHIKYVYSLEFDVHWHSKKIKGANSEIL